MVKGKLSTALMEALVTTQRAGLRKPNKAVLGMTVNCTDLLAIKPFHFYHCLPFLRHSMSCEVISSPGH